MRLKDQIKYYFIILLFRLLACIPLNGLYQISNFFYFLIYKVFKYRKNVVLDNITKSFPDRSAQEVKAIAEKFYSHFSCLIVENISLPFVSQKQFEKRYILEDRSIFEELYIQGKNVLNLTAHLGNWEYGSGVVGSLPQKGVAIYKQLSSPAFDKLFFNIRQRFGNEPVEMREVLRKVVDLNNSETPFILSMVADQAPAENASNYWINFLNQDTNVFLGPEKIARKFNLAVTYTEIVKVRKGVYGIKVQLITEDASKTDEFEVTNTYFNLLEESIKKYPEFWLWSHRRWKRKRS